MPEFLKLPPGDQADVINATSPNLAMLAEVIEKDVWVCWVLDAALEMKLL